MTIKSKRSKAAIDRAKKIAGAVDDSAALEIICEDYADKQITVTLDSMVEIRPTWKRR